MNNKLSTRQIIDRTALSMIGTAANSALDVILSNIDSELGKLFEDRNILLIGGGVVSFPSGTSVTFTQPLKLHVNSRIAGGSPVIVDIGSTTRAFSADGRILYAVIDRTAGTSVVTADATTLPSQVAANQEVFLIAKRSDSPDGTLRVYFRDGTVLNANESTRLGGANSPLTTKGDLFGFSTVPARVAVGGNGLVLTANSSNATGLNYASPANKPTLQAFSANTTLSVGNDIAEVDASAGPVTITLPLSSSTTNHKIFFIKKVDATTNSVIVTRSGSDTIDGNVSRTLGTQNETLEVYSQGGFSSYGIVNRFRQILPANVGGTGQSSYTVGDLLYADTTTTLAKLPAGALGTVLTSGGPGVAPSWGGGALINPMTTGGDLIYGLAAGVPARLPNGNAAQFLRSTGGTSAPVWSTPFSGIVSKTAAYTASIADDVILVDATGGSFNITLPTAVGISGKIFTIKKKDSTITAVGIDTTSSQTIDGFTSITVNTQYESVQVVSNGTNWELLSRQNKNTQPVTYTPTFTNFGTVVTHSFKSWREGRYLVISGSWTSPTTGGTVGSVSIGFNGVNNPGLNIDTNIAISSPNRIMGSWGGTNTPSASGPVLSQTGTSTTLMYFGVQNAAIANSNFMGGSGAITVLNARIPISGWNE